MFQESLNVYNYDLVFAKGFHIPETTFFCSLFIYIFLTLMAIVVGLTSLSVLLPFSFFFPTPPLFTKKKMVFDIPFFLDALLFVFPIFFLSFVFWILKLG